MSETQSKASHTLTRRQRCLDTTHRLCTSSTLHGLPHAFDTANSPRCRSLWVGSFAIGAILWMVLFSKQLAEYLDHPSTTQFSINRAPALAFPAVTVCNSSPYLLNRVRQYTPLFFPQGIATYQRDLITWMSLTNSFASLISSQADDMFVRIVYGLEEEVYGAGAPSSSPAPATVLSNFTSIRGNCYTFNANDVASDPRAATRITRKTGQDSGLKMYLNLHVDQYIHSEYTGARIVIHAPNTPPDINNGFVIAPGTFNVASFAQRELRNLPPPHGSCITRNDAYSVDSCVERCRMQYILDQCGCIPRFYDGKHRDMEDEPVCALELFFVAQCVMPVLGQVFEDGFTKVAKCNCPEPCQEISYDVSVSTLQWPAPRVDAEMAQLFKVNSSVMHSSFTAVELQFRSLNLESIVQQEALPFETFLGTAGGLLGLFLGVSTMTMMEGIQLLVLGLQIGCCVMRTRNARALPRVPVHNGSDDDDDIVLVRV